MNDDEKLTCKPPALAKLLGISTRRVSQLAAEGIIPGPEKGRYRFIECNHAYIAYVRGQSASSSIAKTKGEILEVDKQAKQFKLEREKGLWIPRDEVVNELVKRIVVLKADFKRIENRLMKYPEAQKIVKKGHYDMMRAYSKQSGVFRERGKK